MDRRIKVTISSSISSLKKDIQDLLVMRSKK